MLRRTRTTKTLARRIDLQYFTRPHPFRQWRFWLSVAVPVIALGWLFTQRAQRGQQAYSSGPLSRSHAVFTRQCALCHVQRVGIFFEHVSEQDCLTCHDAPQHQANQAFTPKCSSCHVEHKGAMRLAATSDASCVQCHASLKTRGGRPRFAASVRGFDDAHPEFAPLSPGTTDPGRIKLNHYVHLQPGLMGPGNQPVQMACEDCHRPPSAAHDSWPYAISQLQVSIRTNDEPSPESSQARMLPPRFDRACAGCHTLEFDRHFPGQQVPHDKPETIHAFLLQRFGDYIDSHPAAMRESEPPNRQLPERLRAARVAQSFPEWVQFRVEEAEWLLWAKTCKQCHTLNFGEGSLPVVEESNITLRWLPHAEFDHRAHRMMSCTSCHARAISSRDSADVLLPGIQVCRECHREAGASRQAAEGRCFECHQYHDWDKARRMKGRFTVPELLGTAQVSPAPSRE